jgi:hypothetical protein
MQALRKCAKSFSRTAEGFGSTLDSAFPWVAGALLALSVSPVWVSRFLPLLDEPNHLSAVYIWHELANPGSPLHSYYETTVAPVSYLLAYGVDYLIAFALGIEAAHKVGLSLYIVAIPCAAFLWCRSTGRTVWLSLTTIPLAFSISWSRGYHPFNAGVAACLFAIVAQDLLLARPSQGRFAGALVGASLCYFGHALTLVLLWYCTLVLLVLHRPRLRTVLLSLVSLMPSVGLYLWQAGMSDVGAGATRKMLGPTFPVLDWEVFQARFVDFANHAVNPLAGYTDSAIAIALLMVAVTLLVAGMVRGQGGLLDYRSAILAFAIAVPYFILPEHFEPPVYLWIARGRLAPLVAFFLLLSPLIGPHGRLRWMTAATLLLAVYVPASAAVAYHRFGREMQALEDVLEACPTGMEVLTIRLGGDTIPPTGYDTPVYRELSSWVQVMHGGYNPSFFERPISFPFTVTNRLPAPHWRRHHLYRDYLKPRVFGCVLGMNLRGPLPSDLFVPAKRAGPFTLYLRAESHGS